MANAVNETITASVINLVSTNSNTSNTSKNDSSSGGKVNIYAKRQSEVKMSSQF